MRSLFLIAALAALATARPETYKETEDFQFSRSSSDEGTKQGYYGAQRGNMGGNYEKAHNMDSLAQNQMSSAVDQVHSQVGDAARLPTGNVYTSANTKGVYNQGYKAAELQGRNFQEGNRYSDLHSSHSHLNSGYGAQSSLQNEGRGSYASYNTKTSGYSGHRTTGEYVQAHNNQEALNYINNGNQNTFGRSGQVGQAVDYDQAGYGGYNTYDQSQINKQSSESRYGSNSQTRLTSAVPVRIIIRPGSTVNVPVAAEAYDNRRTASVYDQNSIKTDAEVLSTAANQQIASLKPKSYESSYNYQKKWEKHDIQPAVAVPLAIPTTNPYPVNSELLENTQGLSSGREFQGSSGIAQNQQYASGYNSAQHSSSRSQYQAGYNAQHQTKTARARSNAYNSLDHVGSNSDSAGLSSETVGRDPKQYESSYSYHKSWERQGDPYVIQPISGDGQTSQKLRAATSNHAGYQSGRYATHNTHLTHSGYTKGGVEADCDCDDEGHVRVTRSAQNYERQQVQHNWESEDLTQQTQQLGKLEDFSQQTQNKWNSQDLTQQTQQSGKLEDFGQRTHDWNSQDLTQQTQQSSKLEDFGQRTHDWNSQDLTQQTQKSGKLEDFGQRTHDWNFQDLKQQTQQSGKLEDFGQRTHDWNSQDLTRQPQQSGKLEHFGQRTHNWNYQDITQQTQQTGKLEDFGQQTQPNNFGKYENFGQQRQDNFYIGDFKYRPQGHQRHRLETDISRTQHGKSDVSVQAMQNQWSNSEGQLTQNDKMTGLFQHTPNNIEDVGQRTQEQVNKLGQTQQHSQTNFQETQNWRFINQFKPDGVKYGWENPEDLHKFSASSPINKRLNESSSRNANTDTYLHGLWDKIDKLAQQSSVTINDKETEKNWDQYTHNLQHSWEKNNMEPSRDSSNGINTNYFGHDKTQSNFGYGKAQSNPVNTNNKNTQNFSADDENRKDAGRGDIGKEDKHYQVTTESNQLFISNNPKPFKSLDEIEALSLTKETKEKSNADINRESHSGDQLSVIGINQEWIEEQKRYNLYQDRTTPAHIEHSQNINGQRQEHLNNGYNSNNVNVHFNQHVESTTKKPVVSNQNNLEQQSHTAWDDNQADLVQQVQTSLIENDNFKQQSDLNQQSHTFEQSDLTQRNENFNSNGNFQGPTDDFYEQRYQSQNYRPHSAKSSQNIEVQPTTNTDVEVFSAVVTEVTTSKPGFWKSVGSKFGKAKDTVSSWFKS